MNPKSGLKQLDQLIKQIKQYEQNPDISLIKKSFFFCRKMHENQFRASKEPYFIHPLETALILSKLNADSETIAAALLHDVLEDTDVTEKRLKKLFGEKVTELVNGVTKVDIISQRERNSKQITSLQKILLATVSDLRVLFIKLADKLHNLRTLKYLPLQKQKQIAQYALEVYAPLAHKLGIHSIQREMEEICFFILEPKEYSILKKQIEEKRKKKAPEIKQLIKRFSEQSRLLRKDISIYTLKKGVYPFFCKSISTGKSLEEMYDFIIVVIIAKNIPQCYECLGLIHSIFPPVARKLKDYIAIPQTNSYKSIHTTVIGPSGNPVKIYIRTKEMDEIAEKGMIVAGKYDKKIPKNFSKKMQWLRNSIGKEFGAEFGKTFIESLKTDFLEKTALFFDKQGKIHELPLGSTPLDFAFSQNKETALRFNRTKVNGRQVQPWYEIQSGDIVEYSVSKKQTATRQWLTLLKSKNAIKQLQKFLTKKHPIYCSSNVPATKLRISAKDKVGLLFDLTKIFHDMQIDLKSTAATADSDKKATIEFCAFFCNKQQAEKAIARLKKNKNVFTVQEM